VSDPPPIAPRSTTPRVPGGLRVPADRWAILVELERLGKRKIRVADLSDRLGVTAREAEVALLMGRGLSDQAIATRLGISCRTAEHHAERVRHKIGAESRSRAVALLASPDSL
jgi:DNA-binding CsgD family transcriptional regulator